MGCTFEVNAWECIEDHCYWLQIYTGNNIIKAVYNLWWAKRQGWGCIKLEWRP